MFGLAMIALAVAGESGAIPPATWQGGQMRSALLTPAQMLSLAGQREAAGDDGFAEAVYRALERDPNPDIRNEARFRWSKLLITEGKPAAAAPILRQIVDERPDAVPPRLELAHALQLLGDPDAALRELRAAQALGLPPQVARLVDRYSQALRAARPVGASLEIALAPDSNINRATQSSTLSTIFGDFDIDQRSKAKSGMGLSLHGQAYRRIALGESDHSLLVRASGFANLYRKMKFNDIALDIAAGPELRLGRNQINLEVGATQRWFGQKPQLRSARIGATWTRPLGSQTQLRLIGSAALIDNQLNELEDGKAYTGRIALEHALSGTTGIGLNLSLDRESLKDPGYSTTGWRAGLIGWHDVGRMTFTAEAELGRLHADERLVLFPDKRSERYTRLSLGATFRQMQFRGFAPIVRFTMERNRSSIEFYDYRRTRSEIGVVRAF